MFVVFGIIFLFYLVCLTRVSFCLDDCSFRRVFRSFDVEFECVV